jgi:RimJ/RimL family protein N-acetyltransferase
MVTIKITENQEWERTPDIGVEAAQAKYASGSLHEWLQQTRADRESGRIVTFLIKDGTCAVGFFALVLDPAQVSDYAPCATNAALLRNFFLVSTAQGKGCASRVLKQLPAIVKARFPAIQSLYLVVDFTNLVAQRTYARNGFIDTKEVYLGGNAGPAHVYRLQLPAEKVIPSVWIP